MALVLLVYLLVKTSSGIIKGVSDSTVTDVIPQYKKASLPMDVTLLGIVIDVRPEQPEKTLDSIPKVPSFKVI